MTVTFNIENDEQLRQHIKNAIDGQVRSIVREEIAKTVADEVARVLPKVTTTWGFEKKINTVIDKAVDKIVKAHAVELGFNNVFIYGLVNKKLDAALQGQDWKKIVDDVAKDKIKALIAQ